MDAGIAAPRATLKMLSVKAALDKAPSGPKKDTALKHFRAAETAHWAQEEAICNGELDAAMRALAHSSA